MVGVVSNTEHEVGKGQPVEEEIDATQAKLLFPFQALHQVEEQAVDQHVPGTDEGAV